jgi:hypothetical protein
MWYGRSKQEDSLHLRVGEIVEVRSKEEILATLDEDGKLNALPFMPEMLKYCGQRFKVIKRADKTCDTIKTHKNRRMKAAVHLEGVHCHGEAHGGCQASCLLFWKETWLKRIEPNTKSSLNRPVPPAGEMSQHPKGTRAFCTEADLLKATRRRGDSANLEEELFSCQATQLRDATSDLKWWDIRQYIRDLLAGNVKPLEFIYVMTIALLNNLLQRYRGCRTYPSLYGGTLTRTPTAILNLQPGETVQIKTKAEICPTLDTRGKNRGLWFDIEMLDYCGGQYKVLKRVEKIIDEKTGKMINFSTPAIILNGVVCRARYSKQRLLCPRSIFPYWREIWLKRPTES